MAARKTDNSYITRYTKEDNFRCLEDLQGTFSDLNLVHVGQERCNPHHIFSGKRSEYIIHIITSGSGFFSARGSAWTLSAGQMFLIRPDETVVYCSDSEDPWTYSWVGFNGFKAATITKECGFSANRLTLPVPASDLVLPIFDEMFEHLTLDFHDELFRESLLLKLLSELCRNYAADHPGEKKNGKKNLQDTRITNMYVNQAIDFINETYMNGVTVSDIAAEIGISRTHLNHVFQEELNLSVQSFLNDYRMYRAAGMLVSGTTPIKEISSLVGYADPLVFSKAFKRTFGISPKEYRENGILQEPTLAVFDKRL